MKLAAAEIVKLTNDQIASMLNGQKLTVKVDGEEVELNEENTIIERKEKEDLKIINEGTTVGLDTKITDSLKKEGYARDLIRGVQNLRKESGFEITDRINLKVNGDDELKAAFQMFKEFITSETLTLEAQWTESANKVEIESDDKKWTIEVTKA